MTILSIYRPNEAPFALRVEGSETIGGLLAQVREQLSVKSTDDFLIHRGRKLAVDRKVEDVIPDDHEALLYLTPLAPKQDLAARPSAAGGNFIDSNLLAQALGSLQGMMGPPGRPGGAPMVPAATAAAQQPRPSPQPVTPQRPRVPPQLLETLAMMGFPRKRCEKALLLNNLDIDEATGWLVEHCEDADVDDDLTPQQLSTLMRRTPAASPAPTMAPAPSPAAPAPAAAAAAAPPSAALQHFEYVFRAIALVACGDDRPKQILETVRLPLMTKANWNIAAAARMLWAGERDINKLIVGTDANSVAFIRRMLELVSWGKERLLSDKADAVLEARTADTQLQGLLDQFDLEFTKCAQVAVACTIGDVDTALQAEADAWIAQMEAAKWSLQLPNEMMRLGVRDLAELIHDLDERSAEMVRTILGKIEFFEGA